MCGRFVGFRPLQELKKRFPIDVADVEVTPNYNVAPSQEILAITRHSDGSVNKIGPSRAVAGWISCFAQRS